MKFIRCFSLLTVSLLLMFLMSGCITPPVGEGGYVPGDLIIYVSPAGDARGLGSKSDPVDSIETALVRLRDTGENGGEIRALATNFSSGAGLDFGSGKMVIDISNFTLSGGWNDTFSEQNGTTVFAGDGENRLLTIKNAASVKVERLIFDSGSAEIGGAVLLENSYDCVLTNITMQYNNAWRKGGGIAVIGGGGHHIHSTVRYNTSSGYGGGIYIGPEVLKTDIVAVIQNNTADFGGGIAVEGFRVNLNGSSLMSGNTADKGGAIYLRDCSTFSNFLTVQQNTADFGGGAYIENSSTVYFSANFYSNSATGAGGAVYAESSRNLSMNSLTFQDNRAGISGGGIYANYLSNFSLSSSFVRNTAGSEGGAVYDYMGFNNSYSSASVYYNSASRGGAFFMLEKSVFSTISLINLTITENRAYEQGGALYLEFNDNPYKILISNNTMTNNSVDGTNKGIIYCEARSYDGGNLLIQSNRIGGNDDGKDFGIVEGLLDITNHQVTGNTFITNDDALLSNVYYNGDGNQYPVSNISFSNTGAAVSSNNSAF